MSEGLLKKLQYKEAAHVLALSVPDAFESLLEAIPAEVHRERGEPDCYGTVLAFVASVAEAKTLLGPAAEAVCAAGLLWVAYPKKSSKRYTSDVTRDNLEAWAPLAQRGFEPVRQIALDDDWSALRFKPVGDIGSFTRSFAMSEEGKKRTKG